MLEPPWMSSEMNLAKTKQDVMMDESRIGVTTKGDYSKWK